MRRSLILAVIASIAVACSGSPSSLPSGPTTAPTASSSATSGGTGSPIPSGEVAIDVTVADGAVETPLTAEVPVGSEVLLRITSDVADEVHVHGYDVEASVTPGASELRFTASSAGVFEIEFHESGLLLLRLTVAP